MISDPDRLRALLGVSPLDRLRERLRLRLLRAGVLEGKLTLKEPTRDERAAVDSLFGRRTSVGSLSIQLAELERVLQNAAICHSLVEAVEHLEGPILSVREEAHADEAAWQNFESAAGSAAAASADPWALSWWTELVASGLLRRLSRGSASNARQWFEQAFELVNRTPLGQARIAEVAAEVCGDSHGLDEGEPLGTIVLRGLEHRLALRGLALARADLLARAGILVDDLSATVLVINLRATSGGLLARTLESYADLGEPFHFSLRELRREELSFSSLASPVVFACENPTVIATAADALGPACPPMICTNGQLRSGVRETFRRLSTAGVRVLYHGDFDWPGIVIARGLFGRAEALPWRFSASDYTAAPDGGPRLEGKRVETPWDTELSLAMERRGIAVHEEAVLQDLVDDLRSPADAGHGLL